MKKTNLSKILSFIALPAILLAALVWLYTYRHANKHTNQPVIKSQTYTGPIHPLIYYEPESFWKGVSEAENHNTDLPKGALGGIMPHHLLPASLLSDFFKRWQNNPPETIILIGPNHKERGYYKTLTSLEVWQTPFGVVYPNADIAQLLVDKQLAYVNEPVVEDEHSVAGMMPYIKYYLPNTNVVPLVLRSNFTMEELDQLAAAIKPYVSEKIVVMAPVDFSHYLTSEKAAAHDKITLEAMQNFDYKRILNFSNDNTDSPSSIVLFEKIMNLVGKKNLKLLYNTNSGVIDNNPFEKTTSYFTAIFY
jgi:AmmeMemoRadiSam system protein B